MTTTEKLKLINASWDALNWAFDSCSPNHAETLLDMCKGEEKSHRGCLPDFNRYHPGAIGVHQVAKLFAVHRVAEYMVGHTPPGQWRKTECGSGGGDYLHTQKSCFQAAAMVFEYTDRIKQEWNLAAHKIGMPYQALLETLSTLDYCEFVSTKAVAA